MIPDPDLTPRRWSRRRRGLTPTLDELRRLVELSLGDEWITPSELSYELAVDFLRVALVLERLANDGRAELKRPGKVRKFRRRRRRRRPAP